MTDNDIIKALECCYTNNSDDCYKCPYEGESTAQMFCDKKLTRDALAIINRLQAENERLKAEQQMADGYADALVEYTKEKAIKDYKERLIFEIVNTPTTYQESGLLYLSGVANRQNEIIDIINGLDEKEIKGE